MHRGDFFGLSHIKVPFFSWSSIPQVIYGTPHKISVCIQGKCKQYFGRFQNQISPMNIWYMWNAPLGALRPGTLLGLIPSSFVYVYFGSVGAQAVGGEENSIAGGCLSPLSPFAFFPSVWITFRVSFPGSLQGWGWRGLKFVGTNLVRKNHRSTKSFPIFQDLSLSCQFWSDLSDLFVSNVPRAVIRPAFRSNSTAI